MAAPPATSISLSNLASRCSSSVTGSPLQSAPLKAACVKACLSSCRAVHNPDEPPPLSRRDTISVLAAIAAAFSRVSPAEAAYGEAANIFGPAKQESGFVTINGDGFKLNVPSRWNPSKEKEFPGTVLRYEDNFDPNSNVAVMVLPAAKPSIKEYGSPEKFLESVNYLLGKQAYGGKTLEGGFDPNAVATAAILESSTPTINGKDYYYISVLTRTADGDEGGKHQLIVGTVSNGKLYLLKAQAGDKRWFKGTKKFVEGTANSFSVA